MDSGRAPERTATEAGRAAPERRRKRERDELVGIIASTAHGLFFLALAAAALLRFGAIFAAVAALIGVIALASLWQAGTELRRYRRK